MNPLLMDLVALALNEVGVKELPGKPNDGPEIDKYLKATTIGPGDYAYCSAFLAWILQRWLVNPEVRKALKLPGAREAEAWRYKSARAFDLAVWGAQNAGVKKLPREALARAGDLICYQYSHCGLVIADEVQGQRVLTVEANTVPPDLVGSQRDGNGVWVRQRADEQTLCYVRLLG